MCLLVVEDGFSPKEVWEQVEKLHKITEKPTEDFIVVLPLRYKPESYLFNCYTMESLFSELAKKRDATPTNQRSADETHPETSRTGNHSETKVNLVLLGMSGTGKSASGNTILGKTKFLSKASSKSVTTECQAAETVIDGTHVRVIDTPDMFDDKIKSSDKRHVTKCKQLICQSDPCVYLLVIHVSRFTDGERDILRKFEAAFGPKAKEQTILLFTRGEELQRAQMSFEDYINSCQSELKNIVQQCDRRCVVFENKTLRQHQVTQLMQTVNMMLNKKQKQ
ncbi:GTPase IMAP family member 8-like [Scomber scombrus]|uniref:GTPase IMAP family member 8-like n=1 Tax=Scomber scombrus TaxID=13677 RepID=UPI002DD7F94B|nr:GTPase IMAP family member 8-like [Scomber scombrus]